jgi:hypothetical protein
MKLDISLSGEALLQQLKTAMLKRLNFDDNLESYPVFIADSGPANSIIFVAHNLGKIPKYYVAMPDRACSVYDFNRFIWSALQIQLKCSVPNAALSLILF